MNAAIFARVTEVYEGSDADATRKLYAELATAGAAGELAVNLLRACKKSERAKVYRGRQYRASSYDGKAWAVGEAVKTLIAHPELGLAWGWAEDPQQVYHKWVLYVEMPQTGHQVSFHMEARGEGPDYLAAWDRIRGHSSQRAIIFATHLLEASNGSQPP